ncbi:MAG: Gfo/Idh/MocA family oxidoreductase [Actinobacteria bacterium]|nr:Gfo/Idh/MocA family oxidoreductase [Actinomycetota bacterium]
MTRSGKVRVGIVGAGYIAQVHSAGYRSVVGTYDDGPEGVDLAVVADGAENRAQELSRAWGWERVETDWRQVTRADDVDVVDVSVPNVLHAEIAIDALEHGKHVICEKPLAHDLESALAMAAVAERSGRLAQVCFYYRLWPAIAWARQLVDEGAVGRPQHFRGWLLQDYAADAALDLGWRARPADAGAGALGDLGSHIIDIARHLCGDISRLCANSRTIVDRPGDTKIDDLISIMVEFDSAAGGVLEASWALRGHKCDLGFDLVGDGGAIRFSWERSNEIEVLQGDPADPANGFRRVLIGGAQPDVSRFVAVSGQGVGYRDAFTIGLGHALRGIARGDAATEPSFADGAEVSRVVAAALDSAESGRWTAVS